MIFCNSMQMSPGVTRRVTDLGGWGWGGGVTLLVGQRQSVHGVRFRRQSGGVLVVVRGGPGGRGDGQVAELPRGVRRTPALVPANAAASVQAGDLTEDCKRARQEKERRRKKLSRSSGLRASLARWAHHV